MKVYHISDIHLSFQEDGTVKKPMDQRSWSKGSPNYVGYLDKIRDFGKNTITENDFVLITGDLTHDMKHDKAYPSFKWIRNNINGTIILIKGNHDRGISFANMRLNDLGPKIHLLDENEILSVGPFTFGCYSNHKLMCDPGNRDGYFCTAELIAKQAKEKGKVPVMLSHYPLETADAMRIAERGIEAYLSGHVHCTVAGGSNFDKYDMQCKQTDNKTINGCFFSTATTDVLLNKNNGQIFKEIKRLETGTLKGERGQNYRAEAAKAFNCHVKDVDKFEVKDLYNGSNVITGFKSKGDGSLFITHVNGISGDPQVIYGMPKFTAPIKDTLPEATYYYIANKWDGQDIQFYKYFNAKGEVFVTAKTKNTAMITDTTLVNEALKWKPTGNLYNNLPDHLMNIVNDNVQSINFELHGNKVPKLVTYKVDLSLQPLYMTYDDGKVEPIISRPGDQYQAKPYHYNSNDYVSRMCQFAAEYDAEVNTSAPTVEGRVLYLVDENNKCVDRTLYEVVPKAPSYE